MNTNNNKQWHGLNSYFTRPGAYNGDEFCVPEDEEDYNLNHLNNEVKILVVGAGGLGCEVLKCLALSGFRDIDLIDLDTIDLSNLNRQFLFRKKDIGHYKADVAANFITNKYPHVKVTPHRQKLQEFPLSFFQKFDCVIAGLDNVEARSWLNSTLNKLVKYNSDGNVDINTVIPFIDGGTEGFNGQARVFLPKLTTCFNCSLEDLPRGDDFHICTIASVPRIPEHCIAYAHLIEWQQLDYFNSVHDFKLMERKVDDVEIPQGNVQLDTDNEQHMSWIYNRALHRAKEYGIEGVTYRLTMKVVKNIIPAIASTNAIIAAVCSTEALKLVTQCGPRLNNFMMYTGRSLAGSELYDYMRNKNCTYCKLATPVNVLVDHTLQEFINMLKSNYNLENPSVFAADHPIYLSSLQASYAQNLGKSLQTWFKKSGAIIRVHTADKKIFEYIIKYS